MADPFLRQMLGSVLGSAAGRPDPHGGGFGGLGGAGGLGGVLGGALGAGGSRGGGRGAMLALLLPLAMQWIQRSGGVGHLLQRLGQRGYGQQAASWVGTGTNEPIGTDAFDELVGHDELARMSQQLGVPEQEVAHGFAEILPEVVDQLSPEGRLPPDADRVLQSGQSALDGMLAQRA